jgi:hypothetical protein
MSIAGMATALRRFLVLSLAAAFFVGATVQLLPGAALAGWGAQRGKTAGCEGFMPAPAKAMTGCDESGIPPAKPMPNCIAHFGCLTVPALTAAPASLPRPVNGTAVAYTSRGTPLAGRSVEPELSPPILAL